MLYVDPMICKCDNYFDFTPHAFPQIYIFLVDEYMDIYYCTLYKACIMIT